MISILLGINANKILLVEFMVDVTKLSQVNGEFELRTITLVL